MRRITGQLSARAAILVVVLIAACTPLVDRHGYAPSDQALQGIIVGVDTKETVAAAVGQPSTAGLLASSGWYYVESRFETRGFRAPKEVERQVVAISFDGRGVVSNIERFDLQDGRVVALSRRVTDSNIKGISLLRQLLGNIGNFTTDTLLGNR